MNEPTVIWQSGEPFYTRGHTDNGQDRCSRNDCHRHATTQVRWYGQKIGDLTCREHADTIRRIEPHIAALN